jgi:CHASE3 domain sensor protein
MANKILLVFIVLNLLFAACGGLLLATILVSRSAQQATQTVSNVAQNLLMNHCPLISKTSHSSSFVTC